MADRRTCNQPDVDVPKLKCGHPLPCPWHTAIIHADKTPPSVEIPTTATSARRVQRRLRQIAAEAAKEE